MTPVYCTNCKFYKIQSSDWGSTEWCLYPGNIRIEQRHSGPIKKYLAEPAQKNHNASCQDFEEGPPKMSFKRFLLQTLGLGWK